jgi:GH24 family phage-related lysozyme (muramidase)
MFVFVPVAVYEFDALTSFAFNANVGGFRRTGVGMLVNYGYMQEAANAIATYDSTLARREADEANLLLTGQY